MLELVCQSIALLIALLAIILSTNDTEWWVMRMSKKGRIILSTRGRALLALLIGVGAPTFVLACFLCAVSWFS